MKTAVDPSASQVLDARAAVRTTPVFVWGAGGMLAGEFLRLCELHPALQVAAAVVRSGTPLSDSQPHLATTIATSSSEEAERALAACLAERERAAVVLALPHGESPALWKRLRAQLGHAAERVVLVDLAADYRLRDARLYEAAYGAVHADFAEVEHFAYGLPEFQRAPVKEATRCAAPGCFATAIQLACLPAARAGLLDTGRPWILHGITGSSGSGNAPKPGTHHPHRHGNLWAYSLDGHRHEAELAQSLAWHGIEAKPHLVAHSGPFARGIHLTAALPLRRGVALAEAQAIFAEAYANETFVEVLEAGAPDIRRVAGSNRASMAVSVRDDVLTVLVTLDNLVKGGAGQALQCLNLMLDYPETWGLSRSGLGVC
ncbi:MAG TPA: N-acetyl-gamma-glutamyl-phosphate reductase [Planctomycetota bacterium]|nr:N-acetyl-gamma-glutamyl-phosphate reductase [Planctomycetota bacterium]